MNSSKSIAVLAAMVTCLAFFVDTPRKEIDVPSSSTPPVPFEELTLILETNETDQDAEIVLFADHGDGIERLRVKNPFNQKVADIRTSHGLKNLGIGKFLLESAEPGVAAVLLEFPAGTYEVDGQLIDGTPVEGLVELTHALLPAPSFLPAGGMTVNPSSLSVTWSPVPNAAGYLLEIEQESLGFKMEVRLPPGTTSFPIGPGMLPGGLEYDIGMGTYTATGNLSVAESTFVTSGP
jgi:hypothetical protein